MDDTDRALKFGLFLDSLCAGMSEVLGAAALPSGSRPLDQAQLHSPDATRFDPSRCQWCNDGCGWYTSHSGGFARWVPCDHCNYDGIQKRDPSWRGGAA